MLRRKRIHIVKKPEETPAFLCLVMVQKMVGDILVSNS